MSEAEPTLRTRAAVYARVVETMVGRLPTPLVRSHHAFKHRLVFARDGSRIVGYDNERGRGDHRQLRLREMRYRFVHFDTLLRDFLKDVEAMQ